MEFRGNPESAIMLVTKIKKTNILKFDNVLDIMSIKREDAAERNRGRFDQMTASYGVSWLGVENTTSVERLGVTGWKTGVSKAFKSLGELPEISVAKGIKRKRIRGMSGDELDMQRIYSGDLENAWSSMAHAKRRKPKVISIKVNLGANCNMNADSLFWKGAVCVRLADLLESAGYRVEIIGYSHASNTYTSGVRNYYVEVPIKEATEVLDIDKLAFVTGLAGFFRLYIFRAKTVIDLPIAGGLGLSQRNALESEEPDVLINKVWTKSDAVDFLTNTLKSFE